MPSRKEKPKGDPCPYCGKNHRSLKCPEYDQEDDFVNEGDEEISHDALDRYLRVSGTSNDYYS